MEFTEPGFAGYICIVPPPSLQRQIQRIRSRYGISPPDCPVNIPLISFPTPFSKAVQEDLRKAAICLKDFGRMKVCLETADIDSRIDRPKFGQRVYMAVNDSPSRPNSDATLTHLYMALAEATRGQGQASYFRHSLTLGSFLISDKNQGCSAAQALQAGASVLAGSCWDVDELQVIVPEHLVLGRRPVPSEWKSMVSWATISLTDGGFRQQNPYSSVDVAVKQQSLPYVYNGTEWGVCQRDSLQQHGLSTGRSDLTIASYNPIDVSQTDAFIQHIVQPDAEPDVLILKEASNTVLHQQLQGKYAFCTHCPADMEAPSSLKSPTMVFSKYAFAWESVPLARKGRMYNHAILLEFRLFGDPPPGSPKKYEALLLAACQFSPSSDERTLFNITQDMTWIRESAFAVTPMILVGNLGLTSPVFGYDEPRFDRLGGFLYDKGLRDAALTWKMRNGIGPAYDGTPPCTSLLTKGHLPHAAVEGNKAPKPIDSIMVDRRILRSVQCADVMGDNKGFRTTLELQWHQPSVPLPDRAQTLPLLNGPFDSLWAVRMNSGLCENKEHLSRARALELLERVLLGSLPQCVVLKILPVGSYGLGVWTASSDVDLLCVGSCTRDTFIEFALEKLSQAAKEGITHIRPPDPESTVQKPLELHVQVSEDLPTIKVDLTYCQSEWPVPALNLACVSLPLSSSCRWALRAYWELDYVQRSVPDIEVFRLAHRFIRLWAESKGIYSEKFGYLSGIAITILLTRVHKMLAQETVAPTVTQILLEFFSTYASPECWTSGVFFDDFYDDPDDLLRTYRRTDQETVSILGYSHPMLNTTHAATSSAAHTIASEFDKTNRFLNSGYMISWHQLLTNVSAQILSCTKLFVGGHRAGTSWNFGDYVIICVQYRDAGTTTSTRGQGFVSWVESRCKSLVEDLEKIVPGVLFRIWPVRFAEGDSDDEVYDKQYRGFYLISIDWRYSVSTAKDDVRHHLPKFERQIRGDERHFDATCMDVRVEMANAEVIPCAAARVDPRNWDIFIRAPADPQDKAVSATIVQDDWHASAKKHKKKKTPGTNQPRSALPKAEGASKFRTAADVLNRLRWDSAYDHADFVIGFEDRFVGAMERDLDRWKLEQTHEEFIPQHRILYFKQKSDGTVVWERRTRTDLVFGSG